MAGYGVVFAYLLLFGHHFACYVDDDADPISKKMFDLMGCLGEYHKPSFSTLVAVCDDCKGLVENPSAVCEACRYQCFDNTAFLDCINILNYNSTRLNELLNIVSITSRHP